MKFRRRVKLFPGVTLNFSKTGISTTVGVPGASVNFNRQGSFLNTGIPGTGIYDRQRIGGKKNPSAAGSPIPGQPTGLSQPHTSSIQTDDVITSPGLQGLSIALQECHQERLELKREIRKANSALSTSSFLLTLSYLVLIGFVVKWFKQNKEEKKETLAELEKQLLACTVPLEMLGDSEVEPAFQKLHAAYKDLITCEKIWDIISSTSIDRIASRSAASSTITRKPVRFRFADLDLIQCRYHALHFENANGGDLYFYPGFLAITGGDGKFSLVDIKEVKFNFISKKFVEEEPLPADANVVDHTWSKVNKDGSPDRRFRDNHQIPICLYGHIELSSGTGLNEAYSFSDHEKAKAFAEAFGEYQDLMK